MVFVILTLFSSPGGCSKNMMDWEASGTLTQSHFIRGSVMSFGFLSISSMPCLMTYFWTANSGIPNTFLLLHPIINFLFLWNSKEKSLFQYRASARWSLQALQSIFTQKWNHSLRSRKYWEIDLISFHLLKIGLILL